MSLPLERAMHPDTLMAYEMNGYSLPPEHGFPLRAVVPGWFGMTSVKWLSGIRVLDHAYVGYHQTSYYVFVQDGVADDEPKERVTSLRVKSLISTPARGDYLMIGTNSIRGVAWSGHGPVTKVEISTDNGHSWHLTRLTGSESPHSWQQWEYVWEASQPGNYLIRARATDQQGNTQPDRAAWNFRGFANNAIHVVPAVVQRNS